MMEAAKISIVKVLRESVFYSAKHLKEMTFFSLLNALFLVVAFKVMNAWHDRIFVIWLAAYYVFWFLVNIQAFWVCYGYHLNA